MAERLSGVTQVRFFDTLAKEFQKVKEELVERLRQIHEHVLNSGVCAASFVGAEGRLQSIEEYISTLPSRSTGARGTGAPRVDGGEELQAPPREALAVPSEVAFVASAFPAVAANHPDAPVLLVLSVALSFGYLWEEIRAKGGAYGVRATYNLLNGIYSFSSYRDPRIKETMDTYKRVFDFVMREMDLSPEAVERAVIGTLKTMDYPVRPSQAAGVALGRFLSGETPAFRRNFRKRLLSVDGEDLRRVCEEILRPAYKRAHFCVISGKSQIADANRRLGRNRLKVTEL
jgi:hypothetical protein